MDSDKKSKGTNVLITFAAFVIAIAGMREAASILVPFLLATVIGAGLVTSVLIGSSLNDFSEALPALQESLQEKTLSLLILLEKIGLDLPDEGLVDTFNPGSAMQLVSGILVGLQKILTNGFLIILTVIFILLEASSFPAKLRSILDNPDTSLVYFDRFLSNVQRYVAFKTVFSFVTGVVITMWLFIVGVAYPLLWGLLAFLLNYVPNIGSILAAVPAVLLALVQLGAGKTVLVIAGYLAVNIVIGSVIEPRVIGRGLGLSTLVVFLSLIFWGWVFGPVGMLLSVPLTMTIKIALDSTEETRWIATLLGSEATAHDIQENQPAGAASKKSD
jgi:AI-2 transport protein TqsA